MGNASVSITQMTGTAVTQWKADLIPGGAGWRRGGYDSRPGSLCVTHAGVVPTVPALLIGWLSQCPAWWVGFERHAS